MAEEIVQEVFLRLWDHPDRYDAERGSLRSFLLATCHGRSVDLARSESARRAREEREHRQQAEAGYALEPEMWDVIVAEHVGTALDRLPDGAREAHELAHFGGHPHRRETGKRS